MESWRECVARGRGAGGGGVSRGAKPEAGGRAAADARVGREWVVLRDARSIVPQSVSASPTSSAAAARQPVTGRPPGTSTCSIREHPSLPPPLRNAGQHQATATPPSAASVWECALSVLPGPTSRRPATLRPDGAPWTSEVTPAARAPRQPHSDRTGEGAGEGSRCGAARRVLPTHDIIARRELRQVGLGTGEARRLELRLGGRRRELLRRRRAVRTDLAGGRESGSGREAVKSILLGASRPLPGAAAAAACRPAPPGTARPHADPRRPTRTRRPAASIS